MDGSWEPYDFVEVLSAVESMYAKSLFLKRRTEFRYYIENPSFFLNVYDRSYGRTETIERENLRLLADYRDIIPSSERLIVRRISYESPGVTDLAGLGKLCEVIVESVARMVVYFNEQSIRRARDEQATIRTQRDRIAADTEFENLRTIQIENAQRLSDLARRDPERAEALIRLFVADQDRIASRVAEGKITSAEYISEPEGFAR